MTCSDIEALVLELRAADRLHAAIERAADQIAADLERNPSWTNTTEGTAREAERFVYTVLVELDL